MYKGGLHDQHRSSLRGSGPDLPQTSDSHILGRGGLLCSSLSKKVAADVEPAYFALSSDGRFGRGTLEELCMLPEAFYTGRQMLVIAGMEHE